jgi:cytochrome P450
MKCPSRSIDDLPDLSEVAPEYATKGFPEEFSELYAIPELHLIRAGRERVIAFRNEDLRNIAASPSAGNTPIDNLMRRSFIEDDSPHTQLAVSDRPFLRRFLVDMIFAANPPRHRAVRHILASRIMPKQLESLAGVADQIVQELIDDRAGAAEFDFLPQFASQLTGRIWEQVCGMTREERDRMLSAVHAMTPLFFATRRADETAPLEIALAEYLDVFSVAVGRSVATGGSALLHSMKKDFDALDIEDKPMNFGIWVAANVIDGIHTASLACTNVVYCLLREPDAATAVRTDANKLPHALTEGLRMLNPLIVSNRFALEEFDYRGTRINPGTSIAMFWAAGNRDPDVFVNPNSYDLYRNHRVSMTFGGGIHICPGRYFSGMVAAAVLKGLINPRIEIALLDDRPRWLSRSVMRQPERLMVAIRRVPIR